MTQSVTLSATEEAFVAMVIEEHTALVKNADARRDTRMKVLLGEKAIPDGVHVTIERQGAGSALVFELPDSDGELVA
jgi:hypothetical protein